MTICAICGWGQVDKLPLLELFTRLREAGVPLGLDDYHAVLKAFQGGYGVADRAALKRVCQMLWVRSANEKELFDHYFLQSFGSPKLEITDEKQIREILQGIVTIDLRQIRRDKLQIWEITHSVFRTLSYAILSAGLVLGTGLIIRLYPQFRTTTIPADVLQIITTTRIIPTGTLPPPLSPQSIKYQSLPPRTSEQTARFQDWIRINRLITQAEQAFWWMVVILIIGVFIIGVLWFLRAFLQKLPKPINPLESEFQSQKILKKLRQPQSQMLPEFEDEVQAVQSMRQASSQNRRMEDHSRQISSYDYLPVTQRQMKQSWRYLRQLVRQTATTELDVNATVKKIAREGLLLEPVMVPRWKNKTDLLLLLDQEGSMAAFHTLSERLIDTALRGGRLGSLEVLYFHNCPAGYLYRDPLHQNAETISSVFERMNHGNTVAMIFSDAGAARGVLNPVRIAATTSFLRQLQRQAKYVVWVNPMPRSRWVETSAERIAQTVPMFEMSRQGMTEAIDVLRGRSAAVFSRGGHT